MAEMSESDEESKRRQLYSRRISKEWKKAADRLVGCGIRSRLLSGRAIAEKSST